MWSLWDISDKISFLARISVLLCHVSHILFIAVSNSRYNYVLADFIRPFYSCMLKTLVLECTDSRMWVPLFTESLVSLKCIWISFTFKKKWSFYKNKVTFSLTSAQCQDTQHTAVKWPTIKEFEQKRLYSLLYWTHSISFKNLIIQDVDLSK